MAVLCLFSRPKVMKPCLDALNEYFEGRIDKLELERRAIELERGMDTRHGKRRDPPPFYPLDKRGTNGGGR